MLAACSVLPGIDVHRVMRIRRPSAEWDQLTEAVNAGMELLAQHRTDLARRMLLEQNNAEKRSAKPKVRPK
jgi:hypothetical protein